MVGANRLVGGRNGDEKLGGITPVPLGPDIPPIEPKVEDPMIAGLRLMPPPIVDIPRDIVDRLNDERIEPIVEPPRG